MYINEILKLTFKTASKIIKYQSTNLTVQDFIDSKL